MANRNYIKNPVSRKEVFDAIDSDCSMSSGSSDAFPLPEGAFYRVHMPEDAVEERLRRMSERGRTRKRSPIPE